jgi:hypothetical protein
MSAPNYQGPGQPAVTSGGLFGGLFGSDAPAYVGDGQPSSTSGGGLLGGIFGSETPAYLSAPSETTSSRDACIAMSPDPYGNGQLAIIIPQQQGG